MRIDGLTPIAPNNFMMLLESGRYKEDVLFIVESRKWVIALFDTEENRHTHGLSWTQRSNEGRELAVKESNSWPEKDIKKLNLLKDRKDLVLSVIDRL